MNNIPSDVAIFIATHKAFTPPKDRCYIPIQVGVNMPDLGYLREHQLDNIAEKNPNFCELTVLYFIWKNIHTPLVGLAHYRRYFAVKRPSFQRKWGQLRAKLHLAPKSVATRFRIATPAEILNQLAQHDLLIPEPDIFAQTLREQYAEKHHVHDLDIVRNIIAQQYPAYLIAFDQMQTGHIFYYGNMFFGKKELINQYCEWLFSILFTAEQQIDYCEYSDYNKRIFGFLSERLFTTWIIHHQNDVSFKQMPVRMFEHFQAA
ncbi:DUF4422 domain-containing protein [Neisseriaceae bacterium B1]